MAKVTTNSIRNICLLGHGGSGKTTVAESMLYLSHAIDRMGKITDGNTACDYDAEEIKRGFSLSLSVAPIDWNGVKVNVLDTPGYLDFVGEVKQGLRVADSALIVMDAKGGVEVGAELAWDHATEANLPKAFFINKCDDPEADFGRAFAEMREKFGISVCPIVVPAKNGTTTEGFINLIDRKLITFDAKGNPTPVDVPAMYVDMMEEYRNSLYESIAETSDELMEKFFAEEEITREEAHAALNVGLLAGTIAPIFCGSATHFWGIRMLLNTICESFPTPVASGTEIVVTDDGEDEVEINADGDPAIFVFKTIADPFVGKMSFFKVMSGTLKRDAVLKNATSGAAEKMSHIYTICGKKQTEVDELACGDIGVIAKLAATNTNDTLSVGGEIKYAPIKFPKPYMGKGLVAAAKGDEDKISTSLTKLLEEDLTLKYENNAETKQMLIYGLGDIHLDVILSKMKTRYNTSVQFVEAKIAYRETIKKSIQVEGKHKKQSGGSGQYGHVKVTFAPGEADGLTFTESVVGGNVPKNYFPAVEKGILEAMTKGVLAGFPVVNLACDLFDGSYHPVDSNEISFKLAAKLAYKEGLPKANPVILEPIGTLNVYVPENLVGDVIGDLNKRRGRVLGMNPDENKKGYTIVEAEVPKSEMEDYTIALRAMSQGRGRFDFEFVRYEEVPAMNAQKIIAEAKNDEE